MCLYIWDFLRYPEIVERTNEVVTIASSCVSEENIGKWFDEVQEYIRENNLEEVMNDPSSIFNGEETGFQICPSTGHVLLQKGGKECVFNWRGIIQGKYNCNVFIFSELEKMSSDCVSL